MTSKIRIKFFLSGVEYAIVLPSIHDYLNSIGAETNYMGLVISALSFGAMISAPIYGKLTDRLQKAVYTLRFGMLFRKRVLNRSWCT